MKLLHKYLILLCVGAFGMTCASVGIALEHAVEGDVYEDETTLLNVQLQFNSTNLTVWEIELGDEEWLLTVKTEKNLLQILNGTFVLSVDDLVKGRNLTIALKGITFGFDTLVLDLRHIHNSSLSQEEKTVIDELSVTLYLTLPILRHKKPVDTVFVVFVAIVMVIGNINMGCFIDIKDCTKKGGSRSLLLGFLSQYLYMPLASYAIGLLFFDDDVIRLGFFVLGCCPGSTASNSWTLLFRGDVPLSILMTFTATVGTFALMPLWLFTLGRAFFVVGDMLMPFLNLLSSLVMFIVPLVVGLFIQDRLPKLAQFSRRIIRPYTIGVMIMFLTLGIYANMYVIRIMTLKIVGAGATIAWGGYLFGAIVGKIFGLNRDQIIAMSIETALQNPAIAFIIIKFALSPPKDDLAIAAPIAQMLVAQMPLWIAFIPYTIYRKVIKKPLDDNDNGTSNDLSLKESQEPKNLIEWKCLSKRHNKKKDISVKMDGTILVETENDNIVDDVGPCKKLMSGDPADSTPL